MWLQRSIPKSTQNTWFSRGQHNQRTKRKSCRNLILQTDLLRERCQQRLTETEEKVLHHNSCSKAEIDKQQHSIDCKLREYMKFWEGACALLKLSCVVRSRVHLLVAQMVTAGHRCTMFHGVNWPSMCHAKLNALHCRRGHLRQDRMAVLYIRLWCVTSAEVTMMKASIDTRAEQAQHTIAANVQASALQDRCGQRSCTFQ